ncbi:hypothetical protein D3C78_862810 [compost metagenome]
MLIKYNSYLTGKDNRVNIVKNNLALIILVLRENNIMQPIGPPKAPEDFPYGKDYGSFLSLAGNMLDVTFGGEKLS